MPAEREDEFTGRRQRCDESKQISHRIHRQIDENTQARDKHGSSKVEAARRKTIAERLVLEVHRYECDVAGNRDRRGCEPLALGLLAGRMIDFVYRELVRPFGLTIRERVQTGAEHEQLPYASRNGEAQSFFCVSAAEQYVYAESHRASLRESISMFTHASCCVRPKQPDNDGIVENFRRTVEYLMRGAKRRDAYRCVTGWSIGHRSKMPGNSYLFNQ